MITLKQILKSEGQSLRVRCNKWNRDHGLRCRGSWNAGNNRVWAGEVGLVTERLIQGKDWEQVTLVLCFSQGRELELAVMVDDEGHSVGSGGQWELAMGLECDEFIKVKTPKTERTL